MRRRLLRRRLSDLRIALEQRPSPPTPDRLLDVIATVSNVGLADAEDVALQLVLGPDVRLAPTTRAAGPGGCDVQKSTLVCPIGTVGAQTSRQLTIRLSPRAEQIISVRASATSRTVDAAPVSLESAVVPAGSPRLPGPVLAKTANIYLSTGIVQVRLPGSRRFVRLRRGMQVPVRSTIDARRGRVQVVVARDAPGALQTATFYSGAFRIGQTLDGLTTMTLALGDFRGCRRAAPSGALRAASARSAANRARGVKVRGLWGRGKGKFRTRGRSSSATVRGTTWLVEDYCRGTRTFVRVGTVTVRDFERGRTVIVQRGRSYFATRR